MLYILVCCLFLVGCNGKSNKGNHADVTDTVFEAISPVDNETDSLIKLEGENLWKEANRYKASITDTTFLRTRGIMSYAAIDMYTGEGLNKNYAFNRIVYLKALDRARKFLTVADDRLKFNVKSGKEIHISEDLYLFISDLFNEWNKWLESGSHEILKDEQGVSPPFPLFSCDKCDKAVFYPCFPAIIGIKGYSFPYFPYLSEIMKIKTALYSLFSRLDWYKTVVFPCLGGIYEGIRSLSWEIPVA